jgi:hypothetical protein
MGRKIAANVSAERGCAFGDSAVVQSILTPHYPCFDGERFYNIRERSGKTCPKRELNSEVLKQRRIVFLIQNFGRGN